MELKELLNCEKCGEFTEWHFDEDNKNVVRCNECGKRHSRESIYSINPEREYKRNERGELIEDI